MPNMTCHLFCNLGFTVVFLAFSTQCLAKSDTKSPIVKPKIISWRKTGEYPHDSSAFTQGFEVWGQTYFLESVGQYGRSELRKVEKKTGVIVSKATLDTGYFAEGVTNFDGNIFQLTWREGIVLRWVFNHKSGFVLKSKSAWVGEGWGITNGQGSLWVSDGTSQISEVDARTLKQKRLLNVTLMNREFDKLNELEFIRGRIFANVFMSSTVVVINPKTGVIDGMLDLSELVPKGLSIEGIANGLAWDESTQRLFVTGKYWPRVFELEIDTSKIK
ncbi:MAG: glutaminyl-peptide cyclotransferase [Chitinophagia bacterium]|nr:glutaminyl-peptide cyclotransferase [Chitinophagia bacterium]